MLQVNGDAILIVLAILAQSVMIGYFAGSVRQIVKDHERRLEKLEP